MKFSRFAVSVIPAALLAALLVGCQSSQPSAATSAAPRHAVLLTTGNGTTEVLLPQEGGGMTTLTSGKTETCPQCQADVANYFQTGQLAPKCATCGATRTVLTGTN
jgi:hypothetical protein